MTNHSPTFDRLYIKTAVKNVRIIDINQFTYKKLFSSNTCVYEYEQKVPFHFFVKLDDKYAHIDFTGKALLDDYPALISAANVSKCFLNINHTCPVDIAYDSVIKDAVVLKCDVTTDVSFDRPLKEAIKKVIIRNNAKWTVAEHADYKIKFQNQVLTKRKRASLVIYDKAHEMTFANNRPFLNAVDNADEMMSYFSDKIRFELNLQSVDRIRLYFNVTDISLHNILQADCDPIQTAIDEIFEQDIFAALRPHCSNVKAMEHLLLYAACNYDLSTLETLVRSVMPANYSISRLMEPYKALAANISASFKTTPRPLAFNDLSANIAWILSNSTIADDDDNATTTLSMIYTNSNNKNISPIHSNE